MRKGDRVITSGQGRTAQWPTYRGTVLRKLTRHSVEVRWDGAQLSTEEMELDEVRLLSGEGN